MTINPPWTPRTERVLELFARWSADQIKACRNLEVVPSRLIRCHQCQRSVIADGSALWLCRVCHDELLKRDGTAPMAVRPKPVDEDDGEEPETNVDIITRIALGMQGVFTADDLAVACWKARPDLFSMNNHPYPDNNKIIYTLCDKRGVLKSGLITKVGPKLYVRAEGADFCLSKVKRYHRAGTHHKPKSSKTAPGR